MAAHAGKMPRRAFLSFRDSERIAESQQILAGAPQASDTLKKRDSVLCCHRYQSSDGSSPFGYLDRHSTADLAHDCGGILLEHSNPD